MKIAWIDYFSETNPTGVIEALRELGIGVVDTPDDTCDFVICGSIARQDKAVEAIQEGYKVITYCWDFYSWIKEYKASPYNWGKYEVLLRKSVDVWVPSEAQQRRLDEMNIESKIVHTSIPIYEHEIKDEGFVLDPVRWYEKDPNCYWIKQACEELGIPFVHSEHQFSLEEFRKLVHSCKFMTCGYQEASTGGLTLMEGLYNGKPSLVSNSPYMGAKDYLGDFGSYFQFDDYQDLKKRITEMYNNPPKIDVVEARAYINKNFSPKAMAIAIKERLCELKNNS